MNRVDLLPLHLRIAFRRLFRSAHRQGPPAARKYLVEAAWQGVYRSPTIRVYFERIRQGHPERRKIALVATAHYLLPCMHAMLVQNQPWHEAA